MTRRKKIGCAAAFGLVVLAVCVGLLLHGVLVEEPSRRLERLLRADPRIELTSFVISGRGERMELSDPESLRYLTTAFRAAEYDRFYPKRRGVPYDGRVRTGSIGDTFIYIEVPEAADGMTLGAGVDNFFELDYYWVPLPEPRPEPVTEVLKRMARPPTRRPDPGK
jgi:hypothetical protein